MKTLFRRLDEREAGQVTAWRPPALAGSHGHGPAVRAALAKVGIDPDAEPGPGPAGKRADSSPVTVSSGEELAASPVAAAPGTAPTDAGRTALDARAAPAGPTAGPTPFDEGFEAGTRSAHEALGAEVRALIDGFTAEHERWRDEREREIVAMGEALAGAIMRHELTTDPGRLARLVGETLQQFDAGDTRVTVQLHPLDLAAIRAQDEHAPAADLVADDSLQRGDCRLRCGAGLIEAGVADRLAVLLVADSS